MLRDQLDYMTFYFLRKVPTKWKSFEFESLTEVEQCALKALVDAGFIELRWHRQFRMVGAPGAVEAVLTFTGEFGLRQAMLQLFQDAAIENPAWVEASNHLQSADVEPPQWRITSKGATARDREAEGEATTFALRLGEHASRDPVAGHGLFTPVPILAQAAPIDARVVNWTDCREVVGEVVRDALQGAPNEPLSDENLDDASQNKGWMPEGSPDPHKEEWFGPLIGQKQQLAEWMGLKDDRALNGKVDRGVLLGRKEGRNLWSVWFRDRDTYVRFNVNKVKSESEMNLTTPLATKGNSLKRT